MSLVFAVVVVISFFYEIYSDSLIISNDGPVTLDIPVTVTAQLSRHVPEKADVVYRFVDDTQKSVERIARGTHPINASFVFEDYAGVRTIQVYVLLEDREIAMGQTSLEVHEFIPGNLNISGNVTVKDGHLYISTNQEIDINLHLLLPSRVMQEAEFAYSWTLGEDRFSDDRPHLKYRFRDPGNKWIRAAVVGRFPAADEHFRYKWGYFDAEITVKDPIWSMNISGNTYLEHGQLLDLDISCNGSGPVDYCWKLLPVVSPGNRTTNLSCISPVTSAECSVPILYYFRDTGDFQLAIYVNNVVSSLQRNIEVHIYDVSLRPQLSTVILPLICSVLVVVIIAAGVIIQMRRQSRYRVETADFDFMAEAAVPVETSWEHMWKWIRHSAAGGETTHILKER